MRRTRGTCLAVLAVLAAPAAPVSAATPPDEDSLVASAQRYLEDRAARVTSGSTAKGRPGPLTAAGLTSAFAARTEAETSGLDRFRAQTAGTLSEFSHASVTIGNAKTLVTGNTAEIRLTETTDLFLAAHERAAAMGRAADVPEATSYRLGHVLTFERVDGSWRLAADVLDLPQDAIDPIPYVGAVKGGPSRQPVTGAALPAGAPASSIDMPTDGRKPRTAGGATTLAAFNRQAAVDYALRWALDRNLFQYNQYGNDCANFLSQILRAGGWTDVGSMNVPDGPDKWWINYPSIAPVESRSWPISHELNMFGWYYSQRFRGYANEPARRGDAIFADWDDSSGNPGTDGHLDHSMFITYLSDAWNWNGIYVSYHTTDTRNISMAAVDLKVRSRGNPNFGGVYYFNDTR